MNKIRDSKDFSTVPAAMLEVARGWKSGACKQEIIESGATVWPRSCPRCKLGPCTNLNRLPDITVNQVNTFSQELKLKLLKAMDKKGKSGWENDDWKDECIEELLKHVRKGDPLDVAAYAMFCHYHGWPTWPENES